MNVLLRAFISFEELGNGSNDLDQTFYADIFGGNISIKLSVIPGKKIHFLYYILSLSHSHGY